MASTNYQFQRQAVIREWGRLVNRLNELEGILGLQVSTPVPGSATPTHEDFAWIGKRIQRLAANAGSRIDPNDPETQLDPITLGNWLAEQASNTSPWNL